LENQNILVVDDKLELREVIRFVLKDRYAVFTVAGAEQALEFLSENPVNVVLLDVNMPEIDGITALKEIKQRHPNTEVIMISADATFETVREAIRLGAFGFVGKPFNHRELLEVVDKAFKNGKI